MIPTINEDFSKDFSFETIPSKDFSLNIPNKIINGTVENLEELKQAIYFILGTERYKYIIYSWDYGIELNDLFGMPMSYVIPEVERRVTEALVQDDRIESVTNFEFEKNRHKLHVTFTVISNLGAFESEVSLDV